MYVRATVAYDGTDYHGFQRQVDVPTIQEALETALAKITQHAVTVLAAGRTDAGVHAVGQVISFATTWQHGVADLQRALNAVLPAAISVRDLGEVASSFHPRFDAHSRWYRYVIYNAPERFPLNRRYSLHVTSRLNVDAMQRAARFLVGEHDFATFGQPTQGDVTLRRVLSAEWSKRSSTDGSPFGFAQSDYLVFDIEANAFLYRMVRSVVGTLLDVGRDKCSSEAFKDVLLSCERGRAGQTAPPQGLCLVGVRY